MDGSFGGGGGYLDGSFGGRGGYLDGSFGGGGGYLDGSLGGRGGYLDGSFSQRGELSQEPHLLAVLGAARRVEGGALTAVLFIIGFGYC